MDRRKFNPGDFLRIARDVSFLDRTAVAGRK